MRLRIAILPGDGIGPEVAAEAERVLRAVAALHGHEFVITEHAVGGAAIRAHGTPLPARTLDACLEADAVLLGAVGSPEFDALPPAARPEAGLLTLRRALGAFANLRPAVAFDALAHSSPLRPEVSRGADVLVVRELLGGLYFGSPRGFVEDDGRLWARNTMEYSEAEVDRVARVAFEAARGRRRRVTSVDKANVLETSQLWRSVVSRVAIDYPDVALAHEYVDAFAMNLITAPRRYDVVLTENTFGDILSDEAAVLAGSLGMMPSASVGGSVGLFEPVHGSAPSIAGRGIANPLGAIASAAMLLRYGAGLDREASDVDEAIRCVVDAGHRTPDIAAGPFARSVGTERMGRFVAEALEDVYDCRFAYHAV